MSSWLTASLGGVLIGSGAALLLVLHGRSAGISGLTFGLFERRQVGRSLNLAFLSGLIVVGLFAGAWRPTAFSSLDVRAPILIIAAGLLTGAGAALANGCTSGHGVCGISRGSLRSLLATLTFMFTGAVTVYLARHL